MHGRQTDGIGVFIVEPKGVGGKIEDLLQEELVDRIGMMSTVFPA
jgi:hypothetical protein